MFVQAETVSIYRTQDVPIALIAWAEQTRVGQGQSIKMGVALENRSQKPLYLDILLPPYGLVGEPHMPLKIEVWMESQLLPYRGPVIKRSVLQDGDLTPVYPGGFAGLFFDLGGLGYQLLQGNYRVVLWYDSTGMRGVWVKAKRLWRGRTTKVVIPLEVV